jgi:hypothetical protein
MERPLSLTRDEKYANRAREEMLAAAAFVDWNPSHFSTPPK